MVTYPDGHRPMRNCTEWLYRDYQGRTRGERPMTGPGGDPSIRLVQIVDPIAGYQYVVDTVNGIAHRMKVARIPETQSQLSPSIEEMSLSSFHRNILIVEKIGRTQPDVKSQNLGTRVIDGIETRGVRTTVTYRSASSADASHVVKTEAWASDQLKIVVRSERQDSKWGDSWARLVRISTDEPDEGLFRPPADYMIVDEPGPFRIDIALPSSALSGKKQ